MVLHVTWCCRHEVPNSVPAKHLNNLSTIPVIVIIIATIIIVYTKQKA